VLQRQCIASTEGRAGKRGSHLGTAENPTPNGKPQRCDKDAPTGRMARSLTQREDWTRDLGGCLKAWWQATFPLLVLQGPPAQGAPNRIVSPLL